VFLPHRRAISMFVNPFELPPSGCPYCTWVGTAPTPPLLLRYNFAEGTGTNIHDVTWNYNDAFSVNNPTWAAGPVTNSVSLVFDGTNQFARTPYDITPWTNALTICCWIYKPVYTDTNYHVACELGNYTVDPDCFVFDVQNVLHLNGMSWSGSPNPPFNAKGVCWDECPTNFWTHYAMVLDKQNYTISAYVNSCLQSTSACGDNTATNTAAFGNAVLNLMSRGGTNYFYQGSLADYRIYKGALTSNEIYYVMTHANDPGTATPGSYTANTAVFDGSADFMRLTSSGPTGLADSKVFTLSCWVNFAGGDGVTQAIWDIGTPVTSTRLAVSKNTGNTLDIVGKNSANTGILFLTTTKTLKATNGWTHLYICVDMANPAHRKCYFNGVADTLTVTTYTDDTLDLVGANYTYTAGADDSGAGGLRMNAALAEVWFNDSYLDSPGHFAYAGHPISLGTAGEIPLETSPVFYLKGNGNGFNVNSGTGGNFTITGSLGTTTPP
jgi:hypothetical protein